MKTIELEPSARIGRTKSNTRKIAPGKPPQTLPVHLPKNLVLFLEDLCRAGNIPDGVSGYLAHRTASLIAVNHASYCSGIVQDLFDLYDFPSEREADAIHTVAYHWIPDPVLGIRLGEVKDDHRNCSELAVPKKTAALWITIPDDFRGSIERLMRVAGIPVEYGGAQELLGQVAVAFNSDVVMDLIAKTAVDSAPELDADRVEAIYGAAAIEKLRVSRCEADLHFAKFLKLNAEEAAAA